VAVVTVPLTTLAVSTLAAKDIPQGAALNNMMRQLGGSFGIALVNTYLAHRNALHRANLVTHLTTDNPIAMERLRAYTSYFTGKGLNAFDARANAVKLLDNNVSKQSNLLSFSDAYLVIGLIFLMALPLLLLVSRSKQKRAQVILSDH